MLKSALAAMVAAAFVIGTGLTMLPPTVASHFNAAGAADGFMQRGTYVAFMVATAAGVPLLLGATGLWIRALPADLINLPNKDYWLAPERRDASLAALSAWLQWLAIASAAFLCCVHWLVVAGNAGARPHLAGAPFAIGLVGFLLFTAAWIVALVTRFTRKT